MFTWKILPLGEIFLLSEDRRYEELERAGEANAGTLLEQGSDMIRFRLDLGDGAGTLSYSTRSPPGCLAHSGASVSACEVELIFDFYNA